MIIAFGHRSRVGKDTACELLKTHFKTKNVSVIKTSFAYKLKQACHLMYAWAGVQSPEYYDQHPAMREIVLEALGTTVVELWIKFGNMMRDLHQDTWVNAAFHELNNSKVLLISDMRFPNEFVSVKSRGGLCVKIVNPRAPVRDSTSDAALDSETNWDYVIVNDGNLRTLNDNLMRILHGTPYSS